MKKQLLFFSFSMLSLISQAQWKDGGTKITTTQNVGIGTENPGYKLDVAGISRFQNVVLSDNSRITTNVNDYFMYQDKVIGHYALDWGYDTWNPAECTLRMSAFGGMKFFTQGQLRLAISKIGNVGLGTDNPAYKLDVAGDIRAQNIVIPLGDRLTINLKDNFTYQDKTIGHYSFGWVYDSWNTGSATLWQSAYAGIKFFTAGQYRMGINTNGNVGIGTDNPQNKLDVVGTIRATEVKVETGWADFVFDKEYKLRSLEEVKAHIDEYKHLPDIPSEAEVKENGVSLGEMQAKLLQKIEELTLYVIELKEENQQIKKENQEIKQKLQNL